MMRSSLPALLVCLALLPGCIQEVQKEPEILAERPVWETGYSWHWIVTPGWGEALKKFGWDEKSPAPVNLTLLRPITLEGRSGWLGAFDRPPTGDAPNFYDPTHLGEQGIGVYRSDETSCVEYYLRGNTSPPFLDFPLIKGKTWNGTEKLKYPIEGNTGTFHLEAKVIDREPITVRDAHYGDAVRVEFRYWITANENPKDASPSDHPLYTQPTVMHYSPSARHVVKAVYGGGPFGIGVPGFRLPAGVWTLSAEEGAPQPTAELVKLDLTAKPPTNIIQETKQFIGSPSVCEHNMSGG
jgi:hypothetical protein